MKKIVLLIICISVLECLYAQETAVSLAGNSGTSNGRYIMDQVFTPEAAAIGMSEKIPVNPNTGKAEIKIPLTEIRSSKNYRLPINLRYVTGGIRLTDHPGWVGEGWHLEAGGCINRIINGTKDEETLAEAQYKNYIATANYHQTYGAKAFSLREPGYYHHRRFAQESDWYRNEYMDSLFFYPGDMDLSPDEFQVVLPDVSGSFFFGADDIKVFPSKGQPRFYVEYELENEEDAFPFWRKGSAHLNVRRFCYFKSFTIISDKGVRYRFGGDDSAIDFSYTQCLRLGGERLVGTANTWHLTSIVFPSGEEIVFTYEKDGYPVVVHDIHTRMFFVVEVRDTSGTNDLHPYGYYTDDDDNGPYTNLSYTFLHPSYLSSISSVRTGETIVFNRSRSNALGYNAEAAKMTAQLGTMGNSSENPFTFSAYLTDDFFCRLSSIVTPRGIIHFEQKSATGGYFEYVHTKTSMDIIDGPSPVRLRLLNVFMESPSGGAEWKYSFGYVGDYSLPRFNSKLSDHWGYFNGRYYGFVLSSKDEAIVSKNDRFFNSTLDQQMQEIRAPHSDYMQIGALQTIKYPTGGVTRIVYEPHSYSYFVRMRPRRLIHRSGIAGGLRIKEIIDSSENGVCRRSFMYHNSGILSRRPRYGAVGNFLGNWTGGMQTNIDDVIPLEPKSSIETNSSPITVVESWDDDLEDYGGSSSSFPHMRYGSEQSLRQMPSSGENHVSYSLVTEVLPDSSSVTYRYTDYFEYPDADPEYSYETIYCSSYLNPVTSYAFCRGLLKQKVLKDRNDHPVRQEDYEFSLLDTGKNLYSTTRKVYNYAAKLKSINVNRIYWEGIMPIRKTEITWDDEEIPVARVSEYEYDQDLRMKRITVSDTLNTTMTRMRYSSDYAVEPYLGMKQSGMSGVLVEQVRFENGEVSAAELVTWKSQLSNPGHFVKSSLYQLNASQSCDTTFCYMGDMVPDEYGEANLTYQHYDGFDQPITTTDKDGLSTSYIWNSQGRLAGRYIGARRDSVVRVWPEVSHTRTTLDLSSTNSPQYNFVVKSDTLGTLTITLSLGDGLPRSFWGRVGPDSDSLYFHCPSSELTGGRLYTTTFYDVPAGNHNVRLTTDPDHWLPADVVGGVPTFLPSPGVVIEPQLDTLYTEPGLNEPVPEPEYPEDPLEPGGPGEPGGPSGPGSQDIGPGGTPLWGEVCVTYSILLDTDHPREEREAVLFSFEEDGDYADDGFHSERAQMSPKQVNVVLNLSRNYVMDMHVLNNGVWEYRRASLSAKRDNCYTLYADGLPFDEVRIYPEGAQVETYTWWGDGNLRSRTDGRGVTESYEYDGLGRLTAVRDNAGHKVDGYEYRYATRTDLIGI